MAKDDESDNEQMIPYNIDVAEEQINSLIEALNALNDRVDYLEERLYSHEHKVDGNLVFRWNK
jgi:hypothetical protein